MAEALGGLTFSWLAYGFSGNEAELGRIR